MLPREGRSDQEALPLTCAEYRLNAGCPDLLRAKKVVQKNLARYIDNCGPQVRSGFRQSMPSSSIDNWRPRQRNRDFGLRQQIEQAAERIASPEVSRRLLVEEDQASIRRRWRYPTADNGLRRLLVCKYLHMQLNFYHLYDFLN